jgi:carboxymethylenebutenolidase
MSDSPTTPGIGRRRLLEGALLGGLAGLPLARLLAEPALAQQAAELTRTETINTVGGRSVTAAVAMPVTRPAPAVLLVHEWWGLNDQIKTMAVELARNGFLAVAVDLFNGRVTNNADEARQLTQRVDPAEATDTLVSWLQWLRNHNDSTRKVGAVGWCFGGGWALNAATAAPIDATVVYYGRVNLPSGQLGQLKGPVMGHFGREDQFITEQMVGAFERAMAQAGKRATVYWYDAGHAFANPTGDNYRGPAAQLAWQRTLDFLHKELG